QPTRAPLGQPFVIESRDGLEPAPALVERLLPQRGQGPISLNHYLGMKCDCFRLYCSQALRGKACVLLMHQPKPSRQSPCAVVAGLRENFECEVCLAPRCKPSAVLE